MRRIGVMLAILVVVISLLSVIRPLAQPADSNGGSVEYKPYQAKVRAPEFPDGLDWIGTSKPLKIADLRGKFVLLDFWTYGCINCIHIIPDLHRLETEFANELVIIGVHSAKFDNEKNTANIREIVDRYEVRHPVVNDRDFAIWQAYTVQAWPTVILIDPEGKVTGYLPGEGVYAPIQGILSDQIETFDAQGKLNRAPIQAIVEGQSETFKQAETAINELHFPGKVIVDSAGGRLFIADTGNNRIIIADLNDYTIQAVIGNGEAGLTDGSYADAWFRSPQGMTLIGDLLYVADTNNHAIRMIDLTNNQVSTAAGNGKQATTLYWGGDALSSSLSSPWDVVAVNNKIYIAMAGTHQLGVFDPAVNTVLPFAGSGYEGVVDSELKYAQLAQPSGITSDGSVLYFADSESSAIRSAEIREGGRIVTLVGTGLFDFGDQDGVGTAALLQHPLGVTRALDGMLYIADTYNSKIKQIDPRTKEVKTLFTGETFNEPGGLYYADGKLYIADTNNDAIKVADLRSGEVTTVVFPNPEVLAPAAVPETVEADIPDPDFFGDVVAVPAITAKPGASTIVLNITFPPKYKVNPTAPFSLHVYTNTEQVQIDPAANDVQLVKPTFPLSVPVTLQPGQANFTFDVSVVYCDEVDEQLCYFGDLRFEVPLTVADGGADTINVNYEVVPPPIVPQG